MKISILSLTIDRFDDVSKCYGENIADSGIPKHQLELMVCDNGSKNDMVVNYIAAFKPAYHRLNKVNEGVGRAFNQLLARCTGDYICLMGTDIRMTRGWLAELVRYAELVPNPGIIGIKCSAEIPPISEEKDVSGNILPAHYLTPTCDKVFGTMFFSRKVLETVGGFHHAFYPYGFEDSDFNNRVILAGFRSLYLPCDRWISSHVGEDVGQNSDYRRMKDESLARNSAIFWPRHAKFLDKTLPIYEPLGELMLPIDETTNQISIDTILLTEEDKARLQKTPMGHE